MVYPAAPLHPSSPEAFSLPVPPLQQPREVEGSEENPIQNSAQSGDAWEMFSGEFRLDLQLRQEREQEPLDPPDFPVGFASEEAVAHWEEMQAALEEVEQIEERRAALEEVERIEENQAVLEAVERIFNHPFVCDKNARGEEILSQANNLLLSLSLEDRVACIAQLCSVIQGHANCNYWDSQEILFLLKQLIAIPPPSIHREVCVAYLNGVIRINTMWMSGQTVIQSLETICTAEQCVYHLCPTPETPKLFLLLFYPCISGAQIEAIYRELEQFPRPEVNKVMGYALILRGNSILIKDTLDSLKILYSIPLEKRDFSMSQLQRVNYGGMIHRIQLLQYLVKLKRENQVECVGLMNFIMAQPRIHHDWNPNETTILFVAIARISFCRAVCIQRLVAIIDKSDVLWTAKQVIEFLSCLVQLPVIERIDTLEVINSMMEQPCIDQAEARELINIFALIGSIGLSREGYVRALEAVITKSDVQWTADEVIKFLRSSLPVEDRIECITLLYEVMPESGVHQPWKIEEIMNVFVQIASIHPPREYIVRRLKALIERSGRQWSAQEVILHCQSLCSMK